MFIVKDSHSGVVGGFMFLEENKTGKQMIPFFGMKEDLCFFQDWNIVLQ
jgi:hypothetical protein